MFEIKKAKGRRLASEVWAKSEQQKRVWLGAANFTVWISVWQSRQRHVRPSLALKVITKPCVDHTPHNQGASKRTASAIALSSSILPYLYFHLGHQACSHPQTYGGQRGSPPS